MRMRVRTGMKMAMGKGTEMQGKGNKTGCEKPTNKNNVVNIMTLLAGPRSHLVCDKTPAPHAIALKR